MRSRNIRTNVFILHEFCLRKRNCEPRTAYKEIKEGSSSAQKVGNHLISLEEEARWFGIAPVFLGAFTC